MYQTTQSTRAHAPIQTKLASISEQLSDIGARVGALLRQANPLSPIQPPQGARPVSGPGSRLTEPERQDVIRMLQDAQYSVPEIAAKHRITRAAVYLIKETAGLSVHSRESARNTYPLDKLLSH